jgi:hypothetical protein
VKMVRLIFPLILLTCLTLALLTCLTLALTDHGGAARHRAMGCPPKSQ